MGRTIGLGRICSFVLGFRSLVAQLAPLKKKSEQRGRIFWQRKVWTANFSATMVRQEVWREKREVRFFGKGKGELTAIVRIFGLGKCKLIANFSATMMTSLPSISLSLSLYLSLSPSVPHTQYRKRFRASYNRIWGIFRLFSPFRHLTVIQLFKKYAKTFYFWQAFRRKKRLKIALQASKLGFSHIVMP